MHASIENTIANYDKIKKYRSQCKKRCPVNVSRAFLFNHFLPDIKSLKSFALYADNRLP